MVLHENISLHCLAVKCHVLIRSTSYQSKLFICAADIYIGMPEVMVGQLVQAMMVCSSTQVT